MRARVPGSRSTRSAALLLLVLLVLLPAGLVPAGAAGIPTTAEPPATATAPLRTTATTTAEPPATATVGRPLLGAVLEWGQDSAAAFSARLQSVPAMFGHDIRYPFEESEATYLREFLRQSSAEGAHALLTVKPSRPLDSTSAEDAASFAREVGHLSEAFQGKLFLRFAPDMNASWVVWGQQPEAYVEAFRAVAAQFKARDDARTVMVWQPFLGRDYPFERNRNAPAPGSDGFRLLDSSGDGSWDSGDDAYAPYYPGDDAVEWSGLSAYHDDTGGAAAVNTLPRQGELAGMLTGQDADGTSGNFYAEYAEARGKPLLLQTAAFYSPETGGPDEAEIKLGWWNQVLAEASSDTFAAIGAVVWDEHTSTRDPGVAAIDWRITGQPAIADAAAAGLRQSALVTGPVTTRGIPADSGNGGGTDDGGSAGPQVIRGAGAWIVAGFTALGVWLLWLVPRRLPAAAGWTYRDPSARDSRVDLLRGLAIVFVVVNHLGMTSLFQLFTQEAIGFVSGAELFVLFSGLVLGMVLGPKAKDNLGGVVDRTAKRAGKLYVTALVVLVGVFLVSLIPAVNAGALTTFVDQGTGAAGRGGAGRAYDLYAGMEALLQFPVDADVIPGILLLQFGPWQFNVMGLYVILLLVSPLVLAALSRGKVMWVLGSSILLYGAGNIFRIRLLPSQFEDSFPLLVWQVLFIVGVVAGYHRRQISAWVTRHMWVAVACTVAAAVLAYFSWGNPYLANSFDTRLAILPDATYRAFYDSFFGRTYLQPGRLLNVVVLVVALYALLTAYWKPVERAVGWLLVPLGRATLYVFIMHVVLIGVAANIPALQDGRILLNTAAYVLIVVLLWYMVRSRFLFRVIPT